MNILFVQDFFSQRMLHILAAVYLVLFIFSIAIRFVKSKGAIYLALHIFYTCMGIWQVYAFGTTIWRMAIYFAVLLASFITLFKFVSKNSIYFQENYIEKRIVSWQALVFGVLFALNILQRFFTGRENNTDNRLIHYILILSPGNLGVNIKELITALCLLIPIGFHFYALVYKNYKKKWFFIAPVIAVITLLFFINQNWGLTTFMK